MKKISKLFLVLALILSTNFATAKGGYGLVLLIPSMIGTGLVSSATLAATPYLFKDNTTDYSYLTTFGYVAISTLVIPPITLLTTKDYRAFAASVVLASIGGTIVGFNVSKTKRASTGRKRVYVGTGIGYSAFSSEYDFRLPMEIGYGITENLLMHLSLEVINRTKDSEDVVIGVGASYYMRNDRYIKIILGNVSRVIPNDTRNILNISNNLPAYKQYFSDYTAISIGYGHLISKRLAIELNYINLHLNDSNRNIPIDIPSNINMFNVSLNYRWL